MCVGWFSIESGEWEGDCLNLCWTGVVLVLVLVVGGKRNTFSSSFSACEPLPTRGGGWLNESTVEEVWRGFLEDKVSLPIVVGG